MKVVKYFFVGGLSAFLDFFIFFLLIKIWGVSWFISNTISFSVAIIFNYHFSIARVIVLSFRVHL